MYWFSVTLRMNVGSDTWQWIVDNSGNLRGRIRVVENGALALEFYDGNGGSWEKVLQWDIHESLYFLGFSKEDSHAWVLSNLNGDLLALHKLEVQTGKMEPVFQSPNEDLVSVFIAPESQNPVSALSCPDFASPVPLDTIPADRG